MTYTGTLHAGTHMDAPNHVLHEEEVDRERNGYSFNEIPLEYTIGTASFSTCAISKTGLNPSGRPASRRPLVRAQAFGF
jgi:kynurenine formamidase